MPNFFRAAILMVTLWCSPSYAGQQTVALANGEWPPLLGEHLPNHGYASQIVHRAFALQQVNVVYRFYPWKRSLEEARSGRIAGTLLWSKTADREKDFLISQPVYRSKTMLFFNRKNPLLWQELADLKGRSVGITNGYSYGQEWEKLILNRTLLPDQANTDAQNFAKLLANRIDAFPCEEIIGMHIIRHQFGAQAIQQINISSKPVHEETMHLLISRHHPQAAELMRRFNAGLAQMKRNGELDAILKTALLR
ncbi:MAG: substrate-binding periplasmic protein [Deefgea sp.]